MGLCRIDADQEPQKKKLSAILPNSEGIQNELIPDAGRARSLDGVPLALFLGFMPLLLVVLAFDADEELDVIDEVGAAGAGVLAGIGVYISTVYPLLKASNVYNALLYFLDFFSNQNICPRLESSSIVFEIPQQWLMPSPSTVIH